MSYKVVRESSGVLVCFGPNEDSYSPFLSLGRILYIEESEPMPTPKTLEQIDAEKVIEYASRLDDKTQRLLFEINFDQENRVRALEGKSAITKTQYRDALINVWKGLP